MTSHTHSIIETIFQFVAANNADFSVVTYDRYDKCIGWVCKLSVNKDGLKLEASTNGLNYKDTITETWDKFQKIYSAVPVATFANNLIEVQPAKNSDDNLPV